MIEWEKKDHTQWGVEYTSDGDIELVRPTTVGFECTPDGDIEPVAKEGEIRLPRTWGAGSVGLTLVPNMIRRGYGNTNPGGTNFFIKCDVRDVSIGTAGSDGFRSFLEDDTIFVVEPSGVRPLPLDQVTLTPLDAFLEQVERRKSWVENENHPAPDRLEYMEGDFGFGLLEYGPADPTLGPECLECGIGVHRDFFEELTETLQRHRVELGVHTSPTMFPTLAGYGTPRDIVLTVDETIGLHFSDIGMDIYPTG